MNNQIFSAIDEEKRLICSAMLAYERVFAMLDSKKFSADMLEEPRHLIIFNTMLAMNKMGRPIDILSLIRRLEEKHNLDVAGGREYLHEILSIDGLYTLSDAHTDVIIEKSKLRTIRDCFIGMSTLIENGMSSQELVSGLMQKLSVSIEIETGSNAVDLHNASLQEAEDANMRGVPAGLPSFLLPLTEVMGNYIPETMYVVAGRPSDGKSTLAFAEAINSAVIRRVSTAFISMEMGEKLLREQMAGCIANVNAFAFRRGLYSPDQRARMIHAFDLLAKAPLFINAERMTIEQSLAWMSFIIQNQGVRLVILDYIQLIKSSKGTASLGRVEQVMNWSGDLKEFAKKAGIPIIVLSQLSRQGIKLESVTPSAPMLESLRDSGAIEQDADVVVFIYKKPGEPMESFFSDKDWHSEISVAKNRVGPTGRLSVLFLRNRQRIQAGEGHEFDWTQTMRSQEVQGEL